MLDVINITVCTFIRWLVIIFLPCYISYNTRNLQIFLTNTVMRTPNRPQFHTFGLCGKSEPQAIQGDVCLHYLVGINPGYPLPVSTVATRYSTSDHRRRSDRWSVQKQSTTSCFHFRLKYDHKWKIHKSYYRNSTICGAQFRQNPIPRSLLSRSDVFDCSPE